MRIITPLKCKGVNELIVAICGPFLIFICEYMRLYLAYISPALPDSKVKILYLSSITTKSYV